MPEEITRIKAVIEKFQNGYIQRSENEIDTFMDLFCEDGLEVIGTGAYIKGKGEWCLDKKAVQKLISDDWLDWGDLRLDTEQLNIHLNGQTAWFATSGTVSMTIDPEQSFQNFLHYLGWMLENQSEMSAKDKTLEILRDGITTLKNTDKGSLYIWPIRFSAVLVKKNDQWRFCQITFSFPTIYSPDIRLTK